LHFIGNEDVKYQHPFLQQIFHTDFLCKKVEKSLTTLFLLTPHLGVKSVKLYPKKCYTIIWLWEIQGPSMFHLLITWKVTFTQTLSLTNMLNIHSKFIVIPKHSAILAKVCQMRGSRW